MICLPVQPIQKTKEPISVHFLVDTGAPSTFLSKEALIAIYGVEDVSLIE